MDIGVAGIIIAIILGACSIVSSIIFGYIPRKRQREIIQAKTELLELYKDVSKLLEAENQLSEKREKSKRKVRRGLDTSHRCEPWNVRRRINQLTKQLQKNGTI